MEKSCKKCDQKKALSEYAKNKRKLDGLSSVCRTCAHEEYVNSKERFQNYYQVNRNKKLEYQRQYYIDNKSRILANYKKNLNNINNELNANS